ncbi:DUF362 domain-containing protein [bacterium]|nr:DUF362 domain-containing protein [bacterium]
MFRFFSGHFKVGIVMTPCQSNCKHNNPVSKSWRKRFFLPVTGLLSVLWILVRIIPKPSRAAYPCMKVAAPLASTFIAYTIGLLVSVFSIRKVKGTMHQRRYRLTAVFILLLIGSAGLMVFQPAQDMIAGQNETVKTFEDPLGPNQPIGEARGIHPGRVVWAYDPDATNENCNPNKSTDNYYLDKNTNQEAVDRMLAEAVLVLTGMPTHAEAWDAIFRYFNQNHDKGDVGYAAGEKIFIKINAVHAWTPRPDGSGTHTNVDTSPHAVLAMLKQLVNEAGVPQESIYIGDPYTHIFTHCHDHWRSVFPNIHYLDKNGLDGREAPTPSTKTLMYFSDKGDVIKEKTDKYYLEMENADYLLNIPAMKGHRWGGVTLFGKNFFGTNTRSGASHMHPALHREDYDKPLRGEYGMYRVFVDLLGHKDLGGKILIYYMDALWSCSYEHEPPVKFKTAPFNEDWTSSILLSQDPLAIESVCLDILQAEFPKTESEEPQNYWYANFPAVDDYLHQAADSQYWPEGLTYDPEDDGTPIASLGTHEHWNNETDQQYSRNLGSGEGIELVKLFETTGIQISRPEPGTFTLSEAYPNPFNPQTNIRFELGQNAYVIMEIFNIQGKKVRTLIDSEQTAGRHVAVWNGRDSGGQPAASGTYIYRLLVRGHGFEHIKSGEMILLR